MDIGIIKNSAIMLSIDVMKRSVYRCNEEKHLCVSLFVHLFMYGCLCIMYLKIDENSHLPISRHH
jgi:hypothetical protein